VLTRSDAGKSLCTLRLSKIWAIVNQGGSKAWRVNESANVDSAAPVAPPGGRAGRQEAKIRQRRPPPGRLTFGTMAAEPSLLPGSWR
jgi:hypothetical protein